MSKKWLTILGVALVLVLGLGLVAYAGPGGKGKHGGQGRHHGAGQGAGRRGEMRGRVILGDITAESGGSWTIKPEYPSKWAEKAKERGKTLPELPASVTVKVGAGSEFYLNSQKASASDFKVGDKVVLKLDKDWHGGDATVEKGADPETARQFIMQKLGGRGQGGEGRKGSRQFGRALGGPGGGEGPGGPGGPGGHHRPRPAFGVISAVSADSITITPEVPQFIKDMAEAAGRPMPGEGRQLPASLTFSLSSDTVFVTNGNESSTDPFKVGDRVGVMPQRPKDGMGGPGDGGPGAGGPEMGGPKGKHSAGIVSDYATAEQRMKDMVERMKERGGAEGGPGQHGKGDK